MNWQWLRPNEASMKSAARTRGETAVRSIHRTAGLLVVIAWMLVVPARAADPDFQTLKGRWLRPDGLLLLSTEDRDEPGIVEEWLGVDMYFSMVSADVARQLVREAGFDIEKTALRTQTEGQTDLSYTWILARKASTPA